MNDPNRRLFQPQPRRPTSSWMVATPIVEVSLLAGFADALRELNVTLIASPQTRRRR